MHAGEVVSLLRRLLAGHGSTSPAPFIGCSIRLARKAVRHPSHILAGDQVFRESTAPTDRASGSHRAMPWPGESDEGTARPGSSGASAMD